MLQDVAVQFIAQKLVMQHVLQIADFAMQCADGRAGVQRWPEMASICCIGKWSSVGSEVQSR